MDQLPLGFGLLCLGFFFLVTLIAGGLLVFLSIRSRKKAGASQSWPSAAGTVKVSTVREGTSTDDDNRISTYYYPSVEYEYSVAGQTYTGKNIHFGGVAGYGNPGQVQPILSSYPVGASVPVYYNPAKPSEAVLERKAGGSKFLLVAGIVLLGICLIIVCIMGIAIIRNFMG